MKVAIENHIDLARDINSKAVINTNPEAKKLAIARRKRVLDQTETINKLQNRVINIETQLQEIIRLLGKNVNNT